MFWRVAKIVLIQIPKGVAMLIVTPYKMHLDVIYAATSPYCYITKLSSRLIIFINSFDRFLSLKETRIMVGGLLCKSNSFRS